MPHDLLEATREGERVSISATGAWTADNASILDNLIEDAARRFHAPKQVNIEMAGVERLDTFGAWQLERLQRTFLAMGANVAVVGLNEEYGALMGRVHAVWFETAPARRLWTPLDPLAAFGQRIAAFIGSLTAMVGMLGALVAAAGRVVAHPKRLRVTSMVHQLDNVAWRAVPIILLITFMVGSIIAQQGVFNFAKFGATSYVVDLIAFLVLREMGVLIVCIMVAGRSGSAYTAELGSMKMREEIDALRAMGFDVVEVLALPRIIALLIGTPMLTLIGSLVALFGGGLVSWLYGGIAPEIFIQRLHEAIDVDTFAVGMIKAPFMGLAIGVVACVEGLAVGGSSESLGLHTTASVVKSIFLVIVFDFLLDVFFASIKM